jgi:hypothetical protein
MITTRHERAVRRRADCDKAVAKHELLIEHVIDAGRAVFTIGRPGDSTYIAEIAVLSFGMVYVNGDVDAVVFGRCSYKTWRQRLGWLRGTNYDYAEEKASIGSTCSEMARGHDVDVARADVLYWRRQKELDRETAREAWDLLGDDEFHDAQRLLYQRTGDCELTIGTCTRSRVIMAQACITKLCELLDAREAVCAQPVVSRATEGL